MAKANSADRRFAGRKFRFDAHWDFALQLDADNPDAFWDLLDERASWFYEAVGAGPSMAPKRPGPSSAFRPSPAGTGLHISGSTNQPRRTSIAHGRCQISNCSSRDQYATTPGVPPG